ncbi:MAG: glycosyltransferase [Oscillospiraceae bacterium]|nr:glycosyltransferase [Oscillospiraceae bacterium]MCL2278674.1 glycosyltransferase [Oscillospiraceae bacterium]
MNHKISVIIPCYNVEEYVEKCLESVLSQTYENLEVIVVNDGSTDSTADIINLFLSDKRVKYIDQTNSGVTAARNRGIEAATGEILTFVDSDDWLELDMYEKLCSAFIAEKADVAVCDYNLIFDDRVDIKYSSMADEAVDIIAPDYFVKYCCKAKPNNYIWTRLYKADIVKKSGIRFEHYKLGDDTLFNFKLLPYMKRAVHISPGMYNYLQRSNSNIFTAANRGNLAKVYADTFDSLVTHYESNGFKEFLRAMPNHAATRLRSVVFYSRLSGMDNEAILKSIKEGFRGRKIAEYLSDEQIREMIYDGGAK